MNIISIFAIMLPYEVDYSKNTYQRICVKLKNLLLADGYEIVKENKYYLHLKDFREEVYIPYIHFGRVLIYFFKADTVTAVYTREIMNYPYKQIKHFKIWNKNRNYLTALSQDNETRTYI